MWPAYTNAYALGDMEWIKKGIQKSIFLWLLLNLLALIMLAFSPFMYRMWIGDIVKIPFYLSLTMFIYVAIGNWNNIFAQMLAGVGKIRLSIINSIFNAILYIPLAIFFGERIGSVGVTVAMSIILLTSSFWQPIQCYKIINMKAKGIWNK
jgi:O-antigen/teichoic acid export membrane protein